MKKLCFIVLMIGILFTGCSKDPLFQIKRLARSKDIDKKMEASREYKEVIKIMTDAYMHKAGLDKDIGRALMMDRQFDNALVYFNESAKTRTTDSTLYYWMAICYVNKFKVDKSPENRILAYENYEKSLNLMGNNREVLYAYAQFLVFGSQDYEKAVEILQKTIVLLKDNFLCDPYFLLGRAYYLQGNYDQAFAVYNQMLAFKDKMSKEEYNRVMEFISQVNDILGGSYE